jgi:UDP-N-acetylmuramate dehydrogenase
MDGLVRDLEAAGAAVQRDAPLALLTTLRVGGPAALLATVDDETSLREVVALTRAQGVPLMVLGRGSNLLVADAGWPGLMLRLGTGFRGITVDGTVVRCGAAEPMPSVAVRTAQAGLAGFAWGCAVPGTMGGGVRMNAGAHGADMSSSLVSAGVLDPDVGVVERWSLDRLELRYRSSALPSDAIVTDVTLQLEPAEAATVLREIDEIRQWRREHQPLNLPSCGSVFTNPPGASAGALIEAAGLKGQRIGGAEVSTTHANFIVTHTGATASDVSELIARVQAEVRERTGIELVTEVVRTARLQPSDDAGGGAT